MKRFYWKLRKRLAFFLWDMGALIELITTREDQATANRLRDDRKRLEEAWRNITKP